MTFLAPGFFAASVAVAAAIVALHFIVTRQPHAGILPTARFIPDLPATATARATRPSDLLLMLLRVLLVLAVGAALARPVFKPERHANARVILADVSRSLRDSAALRDSVRVLYRAQDVLISFDSSARQIRSGAADSIEALRGTNARGNLSAAFIAAVRAGSSLRDRADSIELVIVSPFASEELDEATDSVRSLWRGTARLVRITQSPAAPAAQRFLELRAASSDPIQATLASARADSRATGVIVRSGAIDSVGQGRAVVEWPATARPRRAIARSAIDTIGAVVANDALVVSAFDRRWSFPVDSLRDAEVVARWADGEPAAIEIPSDDGCVRSVAIPIASAGDLVIRPDFASLVSELSRDCVRQTSLIPAEPVRIALLRGVGGFAAGESFEAPGDVHSDIAPWLLALAIAAMLVELTVRRRQRRSVAAMSATASAVRAA